MAADDEPQEMIKAGVAIGLPAKATTAAVSLLGESYRLRALEVALHSRQAFLLSHLPLVVKYEEAKRASSELHRWIASRWGVQDQIARNYLDLHENLLGEMIFCRATDLFLKYISDLLTLVYRTRPETLKSNDQLTTEFVLSFTDMPDLVAAIAERRVEKVSYLGVRDLLDYFQDRLNFDLIPDEDQRSQIALAVETRNVIVHNGSRISKVFKQRIPTHPQEVGSRIEIGLDEARKTADLFCRVAFGADTRAAAKWSLLVLPLGGTSCPGEATEEGVGVHSTGA